MVRLLWLSNTTTVAITNVTTQLYQQEIQKCTEIHKTQPTES